MTSFVVYPDAALSQCAQPRPVDDALRATGDRLLQAARGVAAYGLAAAHLGAAEPVVVISVGPDLSLRDYRLLFNPKVLRVAEEQEVGTEGSVSLPGVEVAIERPVWAEIAFDDADGVPQCKIYEGFVARVVLHEIEQLNGEFFLSNLSRLKRDAALRKFQKAQRG